MVGSSFQKTTFLSNRSPISTSIAVGNVMAASGLGERAEPVFRAPQESRGAHGETGKAGDELERVEAWIGGQQKTECDREMPACGDVVFPRAFSQSFEQSRREGYEDGNRHGSRHGKQDVSVELKGDQKRPVKELRSRPSPAKIKAATA